MASFNEQFVSWMLVGLMVLAGIGFIAGIQTDNGVTGITNDTIINSTYNNLQDTLEDSSNRANSSKNAFEDDQPDKGFGALIIFAILGVGQTVTSMVLSVYNILFILPSTKLGIPQVVFNVLSSMIIITLVLSAWRLYRAGD